MLEAKYRLRKDSEIKRVFKSGKSHYGQFFIIKVLSNNLEFNRFCFIVSNKVTKKATKRNLLKRRMREIIRLNLGKISGNYDITVNTKTGEEILAKGYQEIENDLLAILSKAKLFKK